MNIDYDKEIDKITSILTERNVRIDRILQRISKLPKPLILQYLTEVLLRNPLKH